LYFVSISSPWESIILHGYSYKLQIIDSQGLKKPIFSSADLFSMLLSVATDSSKIWFEIQGLFHKTQRLSKEKQWIFVKHISSFILTLFVLNKCKILSKATFPVKFALNTSISTLICKRSDLKLGKKLVQKLHF